MWPTSRSSFLVWETTHSCSVPANGLVDRYHEYLPEFELWHQLSTIGAFTLGLGLFITAGYLIASLFTGKKAPHNPWGGVSIEWDTATPPIEHNFHGQPVCRRGPYDFPEIDHTGH